MLTFERVVDSVIEAPVFTSFTRLGYDVRSRLAHWTDLSSYDLAGRVVLLTGATSGLGLVAGEQLARCGATVVLLGRDRTKTERVRDQLAACSGNEHLDVVVADMGDFDAVRTAAADVQRRHARLDVLIHNAGALTANRQVAPSGIELTVASQVVGPFLLTGLLLDRLRQSSPARVITMSSGGMYATDLEVDDLLTTAIRDILAAALQELIEAELTSTIGAAPGEHTPDRSALRNGHRPKLLSTPAGDVEIGIPRRRVRSRSHRKGKRCRHRATSVTSRRGGRDPEGASVRNKRDPPNHELTAFRQPRKPRRGERRQA